MKQKIINNFSWLFFDKIIRISGGLFVTVWMARYLGPDDFGILNYSLAYVALYSIFVNLGLDQIVVREILVKKKLTRYFLGTSFGLKLIGSIVSILLIIISLFYIQLEPEIKLIIFILSISFIFQSLDVIDFFYQSLMLSKYVVISRTIAYSILSIIKIYFIINEYSVIYFAFAYSMEFFLSAMLLLYLYKKTGFILKQWRFSKKIAIYLLSTCWPLAITVFLISIYTKIDQVMIGNMLSVKDVGIYSVAVKLSDIWLFVPTIIVSTLMPYFVALRRENYSLYEKKLIQLYSIMFWLGILVGFFVLFFGEILIIILFGDAYRLSYLALVLNVWNGVFISQALARGIWLINEDLQKYRLYNNIIIVVLNIVANLILIPKLGIVGAALATLFTQFIGTWVVSFLWKPLRGSTLTMLRSVNPVYLFGTK